MPKEIKTTTESVKTDNRGQQLELLDRGLRDAQILEVRAYMEANFEDEYGQDRVAHVMEKLSEFEGLETWFTERQIARLALLDVVDPSYSLRDSNRPNTHFEDVAQMAQFVDSNFDWIKKKIPGLKAEKTELMYAILNSDIGKAGIGSSTVIAKFFNIKDDEAAALKHSVKLSKEPTVGEFMKLGDLDGEENWMAIADYLNLDWKKDKKKLASMKRVEIYKLHELKLQELSDALHENPEFKNKPEKIKLLLQLCASHHANREIKIVESLDSKGYVYDAVFLDILDKTQAFLLRKPRRTIAEAVELLKSGSSTIPNDRIRIEYNEVIEALFNGNDKLLISKELLKLEKAR